ncbi:methyltransferase type 11 [Lottiidibacillus patelloidae]|uniref:Methyltransferase type 11 n=1 Tax=Lottiidibacillus patelloidae TaxID=2670334 RepID=A0A263BS08_9BACI|nr:YkvA family protein [Lottiidibacillus patelloidae]OZM56485.1 methyltransferase type 11 [Lottiidibacillus patelloidae]
MADKEKYEHGMKKYESKAKQYIDDKDKTEGLLKKALSKAKTRQSSLADVWEKLHLLLELVQAWKKGDYKEIPRKTIVTVIATILYFVSPLDLVPDFIAGLGIFDDAAVIAFAVKQISTDLDKFKLWQQKNSENIETE